MSTFSERLQLQFRMIDERVDWIVKEQRRIVCNRCGESEAHGILNCEKTEEVRYEFTVLHMQCRPSRTGREEIIL